MLVLKTLAGSLWRYYTPDTLSEHVISHPITPSLHGLSVR